MSRRFSSTRIGALVAAIALTSAGARAQDADLAAARDLYASAAYEEALSALTPLLVANFCCSLKVSSSLSPTSISWREAMVSKA